MVAAFWSAISNTATVFDVARSLAQRSLEHALGRALDLHADPVAWRSLVRRAMRQDWSWDTSGRDYLRLFEHARRRPPVAIG
jgi:glycogen synthase